MFLSASEPQPAGGSELRLISPQTLNFDFTFIFTVKPTQNQTPAPLLLLGRVIGTVLGPLGLTCTSLMGEPVLGEGKEGQQHSDSVSGPVRTLRVKMVLLGSSGVGKSSLALRFGKDEFRKTSPTVGCAYLTRVVHLSDVSLRFEIWDTAGQEKYHSVTPLYYRGAQAALVLYDISSRVRTSLRNISACFRRPHVVLLLLLQETFIRAQLWVTELERQCGPGSTVVWLVGNKADLDQNRQVSAQEGQVLAGSKGLSFIETSALSGDQVSELLDAVAHRVYGSMGEQQGGLSEWRETALLDQNHQNHQNHQNQQNHFWSCCKVGP
ncbi:ras-related protein Rab-17 isoform X3 [Fundulus heteroclitus]|uniref:ras-related protein Rab-17 isoform X3 n=1 Tax=Fundulus heteroclitus TaxID=8078 RepID=UPI00165A36D1|nr:ras-related protein Rab-17 isoform X3 [Fundulus heteroclitus]